MPDSFFPPESEAEVLRSDAETLGESDPSGRPLPGQHRFVAPDDEVEVLDADPVRDTGASAGFWKGAWLQLRTSPTFIVASIMIILVILICLFPSLFAHQDPRYCQAATACCRRVRRIGSAPTCRAVTYTHAPSSGPATR